MKTSLLIPLVMGLCHGFVLAADPIQTASGVNTVGVSAAGNSFGPSFSADGRFLLFVSQANNLVANDNRFPFLDVFVRDLLTGENSLISVNGSGHGGGNDNSNFPAFSQDGERVVFASAASDLVTNDLNGQSDVFVRDRLAGTTRLISINHAGTGSATSPPGALSGYDSGSSEPGISGDGRRVVFRSDGTNLVSLPDDNGEDDIYVRDLETATTRLVSVSMDGSRAANGRSSSPLISADGRKVVFVSTALDITAGVSNQSSAVYVRDLDGGGAQWLSRDLPFQTSVRCVNPVLSADGNVVVFTAESVNGFTSWLCRRDLVNQELSIIATNETDFGFPVMSDDGKVVAFERTLVPSPEERAIFLWRWPGTGLELISTSNQVAFGSAISPALSADGRYVSYVADVPVEGSNKSVAQVFLRDTLQQTTRIVTVGATGQPSRWSADPQRPTFLGAGPDVAFASSADDLVSGDHNQASDLFLHHPATGVTELLTRREANSANQAGALVSFLFKGSISLDGRFVLFRTQTTNLSSRLTNATDQVAAATAVHDRLLGTNVVLDPGLPVREAALSLDGQSVAFTSGDQIYYRRLGSGTNQIVGVYSPQIPISPFPFCANPVVNRDGTRVAFESLLQGQIKGIFLRDLSSNSAALVSVTPYLSSNGNRDSSLPQFTVDSRWVIFQSLASDLTTNLLSPGTQHIYGRDLLQAKTTLLSKFEGAPLSGNSTGAVLAANSRTVAFVNGGNRVFVSDLKTGSNQLACSSCRDPSLSADGSWIASESWAGNGTSQILLRHLSADTNELISVNQLGSGGGNGPCRSPVVNGNGRFVAFLSAASDLVPNDDNGQVDLFLRDRATQTTFLLSPGKEDRLSVPDLFKRLLISPSGQTIVFQSFASRLTSQDYNNTADVFTLELGVGDTDGDGMDDGWEVAYFDTLQRDGSGDFDRDGVSDGEEFRAGTNPIDRLGILAITAWVRNPDGSLVLYWSSLAGRSYRVEVRTDLTIPGWSPIGTNVLANASTASYRDTPDTVGQRFYRVVLQP